MSKLFADVDRISVGTKLFFVATALLLMLAYSVEKQPPAHQVNLAKATTPAPTAAAPASGLDLPAEAPESNKPELVAKTHAATPRPKSNHRASHGVPISVLDPSESPHPTSPTVKALARDGEAVSAALARPRVSQAVHPSAPPVLSTSTVVPARLEPLPSSPILPRSPSDQRNLYACLNGISFNCDKNLLIREEQRQVHASDLRRNLYACLNGISFNCDKDLLTPEEQRRVHASDLRRNLYACLNGISYNCNKNLLTPQERERVRVNDLRRNLSACMNGISYNCDKTLLTPEQNDQVHASELRRNLSACLNGISYNCDQRLLTPEQLLEVQKALQRKK